MRNDILLQPVTPKPRRRWFQFRLRTMLGFVALLSIVLSLIVVPAERQRRSVAAVRGLGGYVEYEDERENRWSSLAPRWVRGLLGDNFFRSVISVEFSGGRVDDAGLAHMKGLATVRSLYLDDTQITDLGLAHLQELTLLKVLDLSGTRITNAGLAYLKGMHELTVLDLYHTNVSDPGLAHLNGFGQLRRLIIGHTQVSDTGVSALQRALPACDISQP